MMLAHACMHAWYDHGHAAGTSGARVLRRWNRSFGPGRRGNKQRRRDGIHEHDQHCSTSTSRLATPTQMDAAAFACIGQGGLLTR
jgi:hypothetical protein